MGVSSENGVQIEWKNRSRHRIATCDGSICERMTPVCVCVWEKGGGGSIMSPRTNRRCIVAASPLNARDPSSLTVDIHVAMNKHTFRPS